MQSFISKDAEDNEEQDTHRARVPAGKSVYVCYRVLLVMDRPWEQCLQRGVYDFPKCGKDGID